MKKTKYYISLLMLFLVSCSQEELLIETAEDLSGCATVTFSVVTGKAQPEANTRGGSGAQVDPYTCTANEIKLLLFRKLNTDTPGDYLYSDEVVIAPESKDIIEEDALYTDASGNTSSTQYVKLRKFNGKVTLDKDYTYRILAFAYDNTDTGVNTFDVNGKYYKEALVAIGTDANGIYHSKELFYGVCKTGESTEIAGTATALSGMLHRITSHVNLNVTDIPTGDAEGKGIIKSMVMIPASLSLQSKMESYNSFQKPEEGKQQNGVIARTEVGGATQSTLSAVILPTIDVYLFVDVTYEKTNADGTTTVSTMRYLVQAADTLVPTDYIGRWMYVVKDGMFRFQRNVKINISGTFEQLKTSTLRMQVSWDDEVFGGVLS